MKKILVIGSEGFTGRHFCTYVDHIQPGEQYNIFTADIAKADRKASRHFRIGSVESLSEALQAVRPEFIVNFAGLIDKLDFDQLVHTNVILTYDLLRLISELSISPKKILLVGSAAEYGDKNPNPVTETDPLIPVNPYGLSKKMQTSVMEYFSHSRGLNIVMARTFNIIGEGLSEKLAFGSFAKQIAEADDGGEILVGNVSARRDVMDILEVVKRYWNILIDGRPGEIYNVCSGQSRTIKEILEKMINKSGKNLRITIENSRFQDNDISDIYGDTTKYLTQFDE